MRALTINAKAMKVIIETNLSLKDDVVVDHQSRVIEAKSWDEYVEYYRQNIESDRKHSKFKSLTGLFGDSLPRYGNITELKYDNFHLSCYYINPNGQVTMKLAYLCNY